MNAKVIGIFCLLIVLCLIMSIFAGDTFLTPFNLENLVRRTSMYAIIGIGVAFVIITGGIDLSIGSIIAVMGVLLAKFLAVGYAPVDFRPIEQVHGEQQEIIFKGDITQFEIGDDVRFFGGRRARSAMVTITGIEQDEDYTAPDGRTFPATRVSIDKPLTADDRYGQIASVTRIAAVERDTESEQATVTLVGRHEELARRDQIFFYGPEDGQTRATVEHVELLDDRTRLRVDREIALVDDTWLTIPHQRKQTMSIPMALGSVMGIGMFLGLLHGLLVAKMNIQPFVVTLCGLLIYRGAARWLVDDQTVGFGSEYHNSLTPLARGKLPLWETAEGVTLGLPYPALILLGVGVLAAIFLNKTIWGRYMLATGRNEEAARFSGINTGGVIILAYVICTALAALGGILFALDTNSVAPSSHGFFFELYAIAAAVLGGCSLRGGEGGILGVVIAAAVLRVLHNMINLLGLGDTLEWAVIGAVILAGVMADELVKRYAAKRRTAKRSAAQTPEAEPAGVG
ncbi:MAG: ABC transporter permease [Phycisphaeraceae bacterium]